ncbi:MAG: DUF2726 domain-containing protein [Chloroflexi bacterium]|nr:DUF2726 domain-containing protein [Chloroflexota bacterium]
MENFFLWIILIFVLVLVTLAVVAARGTRHSVKQDGPAAEFPYRKSDYLFTKAERSFYENLTNAVGDDMRIFAKVKLADLVYLPKTTKNRQAYLNKVQSKHVDFLLCSRQTISPLLAIELDDSSHERGDRPQRDAFVNQLFDRIQLPLVRIPVKTSYDPKQLAESIRKAISHMDASDATKV